MHPRDFHILFGLLAGPLHGYGLVKAIERRTEGELRLDPANLYRAIQRLVGDQLLIEAAAPAGADEDGRRRRFYALTDLGRETLLAEADRMRSLADAVATSPALPTSDGA